MTADATSFTSLLWQYREVSPEDEEHVRGAIARLLQLREVLYVDNPYPESLGDRDPDGFYGYVAFHYFSQLGSDLDAIAGYSRFENKFDEQARKDFQHALTLAAADYDNDPHEAARPKPIDK